jgi:hypothetical protein
LRKEASRKRASLVVAPAVALHAGHVDGEALRTQQNAEVAWPRGASGDRRRRISLAIDVDAALAQLGGQG